MFGHFCVASQLFRIVNCVTHLNLKMRNTNTENIIISHQFDLGIGEVLSRWFYTDDDTTNYVLSVHINLVNDLI